MFDIKMVTTDKNNRRSGLGTDLLRRSVQLAASLGYRVRTKGRGRIRDALYCIDISREPQRMVLLHLLLFLSSQAIKTEATGLYSRKAFERLGE